MSPYPTPPPSSCALEAHIHCHGFAQPRCWGHGAPRLPTQSLSLKLREGGYKDKAWGVPCSASSPRSHGGSVLSCRQACRCSPHNSPQRPHPVSLALGSVLRKDTPAALVWALPSMQGHVAQTWPGDPLL